MPFRTCISGVLPCRFLALLILLVGTPLYGFAQVPDLPPAELATRLQTQQALARQEAQDWASARGLPTEGARAGRAFFLARIDGVRPVYLTTHNVNAALLTRTTALHPGGSLGLNLDGSGLAVGIWDAGAVRSDHQEFTNRLTLLDNVPSDFHATHVGGTLAAAGVRPQARGMAFGAELRSYDWDNDLTEMANEAKRELLLSNHSYGPVAGWAFGAFDASGTEGWYWFGDTAISPTEDYTFGRYDEEAALFDEVAHAHPMLLPVISVGNDRTDTGPSSNSSTPYFTLDASGNWVARQAGTTQPPPDGNGTGFDTIAGQATAKNVLTIGSVGIPRIGESQLSRFSSMGPTDDGRIKPDLVGSGEAVFSTSSSGAATYAFNSGTSMATANVTGSLALLQQHHVSLRGRYLRAATLKALAIHSASDLGEIGPDYRYGWGLLNTAAAIAHLESTLTNPIALVEGSLPPSQLFVRTVRSDAPGPVRITLAWNDPPPPVREVRGPADLDDPTPRLVHDLDLRLISEADGLAYMPYAPDPAVPGAPSQPGDNSRDNVEQIYRAHLPAGTYRLEVRHKGTLTEAQPFALLVQGLADEAPQVALGPFDGAASAGEVVLSWDTLREAESGRFVLERLPLTIRPGLPPALGPAVRIGEVDAAGASTVRRSYAFTDSNVAAGWHRYRLFFEQGGILTALGAVDLRVPAPEQLVVQHYPNPSTGPVTVLLDLPRETAVAVAVYDVMGREVSRLPEEILPAGRATISLDGTSWSPGVYLVRVATRSGVRTHRLVIAR